MELFKFNVFSGGYIEINLEKCKTCTSKACIVACERHLAGNILEDSDGCPTLKVTLKDKDDYVRECVECLACELECNAEGKGALKIVLPMPELEKYLNGNID